MGVKLVGRDESDVANLAISEGHAVEGGVRQGATVEHEQDLVTLVGRGCPVDHLAEAPGATLDPGAVKPIEEET